jgi:hypothetical protein
LVTLVCALSLVWTGTAGAELLGWWTFDEGDGTIAYDGTDLGNDGTLTGDPAWVTGQLDGALEFDGDDSVNCGQAPQLGVTTAMTIACWVNPSSLTGEQGFVARSAAGIGYAFKTNAANLRFTTPGVMDHNGSVGTLQTGTWQHIAVTFLPSQDGGLVFYINGVATDRLRSSALAGGTATFQIGNNHWSQYFHGLIDDVQVYDEILSAEQIAKIMKGLESKGLASNPVPENEATDIITDTTLSWTTGEFAATRNVYFGTSFDDVNDASTTDPRGVLVSEGQTDTVFAPDGRLEYGQTYYWRIDEVNAAPDSTVFKGKVWSFTTETYAYPITRVTVQASNEQSTSPAIRTIDGSGLDELDQHSADLKTMWATSSGLPVSIQYTFEKEYKLHELWVWNANSELEAYMGFGAKDVAIEYSTDGETWTALENVPEFAQGTGQTTYTANTIVDFGEVMAKYVKLTINDNWGVSAITSLSEVRFFYTPAQAYSAAPADGATDVALDATLAWRPGREVTSHEVYFGTDANAVAQGDVTAETVTDHSYTPASMNFGTTYSWKVDEVGDAGVYAGDVWSFTSKEFEVVEDFESYNDDIEAETTIWHAWIDGVTTKASGSTVGYENSPFAERKIVHTGKQSMPFAYDNATEFRFSEAQRTFDPIQKWTGNGADEVSLWVHGNPAKFVETAPGQYTISSKSADIWGTADNFRFVYKRLNGNGAITAKVLSITGGSTAWAKVGVMIRGSLDPASSYALMHPTPDGRRSFQNRPADGANALSAHSATGAITLPLWVKVERQGNQITGYYSLNGTTWTKQPDTENTGTDKSPNPQTITMGDSIYIGLAVAGNNGASGFCFGEFSDVVTTGGVTGDWTVANIGANPGNDVATMYVTVEDSAGKSGTASNADIVTSTDWTRWAIPMSDFAGVNFGKVKKMTITIGDKNATTADGTGIVFIDDIGFGHAAE